MNDTFLHGMIKDVLIRMFEEYQGNIPPVAIYPFGKDGLFVKQVLNQQFGITEKYLVDNNLCKYNPNIISGRELMAIDEDTIIIVSIILPHVNSAICNELTNAHNPHLKVVNISDPIILPIKDHTAYYQELADILRVKAVKGYDYVRIGRLNDGGYAMINDFRENMSAYSFGISDDMSWDIHLHDISGMRVHMYDHTIPCAPTFHHGCDFYRIGLGVADDREHDLLSLLSVLKENGDMDNRNGLIMKMDIEGAEWRVLEGMPETVLQLFRQMVFEFHGMIKQDNDEDDIRLRVLRKLNTTHQVVWVHGNNCTGAVGNQEMTMPFSIEVLYLNRMHYSFEDNGVHLPLTIDMPNLPGRRDFNLSYLAQ